VAEVFVGLIEGSRTSILRDSAWRPTLGERPGKFEMRDLLKLSVALNPVG
jgi:hypothetical protein